MNKEFLLERVKEIYTDTLEIRRYIHQNPELSYQEFNTAKFIRNKLTEFGIKYEILANTGTVAQIGKGDSCVALRADIDALPILEETGLEFSSANNGIMHACGHDMHTSMLLAASRILKENEDKLDGVVKIIFQPAEEKIPGGAIEMIAQGVLENPKPSAIFAQHIYPAEFSGTISVASGPVLASADELYWTIKGKGSHAAQPHLGNDAILAASQMINYYQSILTKFKNPLESSVISVTSIHGGSATNIFPEEVKMMGTLRTYNNNWRSIVHKLLVENSKSIAELYGCECDMEILKGYPPLVNNIEATNFVKQISKEIVGENNTFDFEPKMWAEDFAYYAEQIPACFWLLGVNPSEINIMPPLHNSKLNPSEEAMINGITMLVSVAYNYLNNKNSGE
jgi:amidohydrolase